MTSTCHDQQMETIRQEQGLGTYSVSILLACGPLPETEGTTPDAEGEASFLALSAVGGA